MTRRAKAPDAPAYPTFAKGTCVEIIDGLSRGQHGTVIERWHDIADVPQYLLELTRGRRVIRVDYLREVG